VSQVGSKGRARLGEEDEVLGVLVALGGLLRRLGGLLQLRLQEGARVEGRVVGRVGRVAPARGVPLGHEVLPELDNPLLSLAAFRVGVGVEAEDEPVLRVGVRVGVRVRVRVRVRVGLGLGLG
jgi:hypothetical protein